MHFFSIPIKKAIRNSSRSMEHWMAQVYQFRRKAHFRPPGCPDLPQISTVIHDTLCIMWIRSEVQDAPQSSETLVNTGSVFHPSNVWRSRGQQHARTSHYGETDFSHAHTSAGCAAAPTTLCLERCSRLCLQWAALKDEVISP